MASLKDRRAIVCGSTQGIGRACAAELARLGATVTLVARNEDRLRAVCAELDTAAGQSHDWVCADFSEPASLADSVTRHIEKTGPIHILVNNTGGPPSGPIVDATPEQFVSGFSNHVLCNQLLVQTLLPGMREEGYGRIINIISTSVLQPIRGSASPTPRVVRSPTGAVPWPANWRRSASRSTTCSPGSPRPIAFVPCCKRRRIERALHWRVSRMPVENPSPWADSPTYPRSLPWSDSWYRRLPPT